MEKFTENMLEACKNYLDMEFKLVPAPYKTKSSLIKDWLKKPYTTYEEIKKLAKEKPYFNIGIVTGKESNLLVIDIDINKLDEKGNIIDSMANYQKLEGIYGKLPPTVTARSGSGGLHMYFKAPKDTTIKSKSDFFGEAFKGIDIKCNGGKIMAPPSMHECGNQYAWINGKGFNEIEIAELPQKWYEAMVEISNLKPISEPIRETIDGEIVITKGNRNETLFKKACSFLKSVQSKQELLTIINSINNTECSSPLEESEIRNIVESAWRYKQENNSTIQVVTKTIELFSAKELCDTELIPINWIIPYFLGEGLSILSGNPKVGKSWFALNLAISVASGTTFLDLNIPNAQNVLYLALEDGKHRLQKRIKMLEFEENKLENLKICLDVGEMQKEGLKNLEKIINETGAKLVIIDTWFKFRGITSKGNINAYDKDYSELSVIKKIADTHHIAIMLVHHLKKGKEESVFMQISGSVGYSGAADAMYILEQHDRITKKLSITGRDIQEDEIYLSVDKNYMYHNENGAIPPPSPFDVLSPEKKEIAQFFKDNIGTQFNAKQLSAIFHKSDVSIRQHLRGLTEKGFLKKVKTGIYEYDPDNFYEQQS